MLKVRVKFEGKCKHHPRYSPEKEGEAGIKGGCRGCAVLLALYQQASDLEKSADTFRKLYSR